MSAWPTDTKIVRKSLLLAIVHPLFHISFGLMASSDSDRVQGDLSPPVTPVAGGLEPDSDDVCGDVGGGSAAAAMPKHTHIIIHTYIDTYANEYTYTKT